MVNICRALVGSCLASLLLLGLGMFHGCSAYYMGEKEDIGTLTGDVQNWAMLIQNYILQVSVVR